MKNADFRLQFVCVGPQRTSSTWLHEVLLHHPDVGLPHGVKETKFFDRYYSKGMDWYQWHFRDHGKDKVCGEIGPSYFDNGDVVDRLRMHFPSTKIIINVRNPISQAYSLFRHHHSKGRVSADFYKAIKKYPRIATTGHYQVHSERWERAFPGSVTYLVQDDVRRSPQQTLNQCTDSLSVRRIELPLVGKSVINAATSPRWPALARVTSGLASVQRGMRMHATVELGKRMGLKKIFHGGQADERNAQ